MISEVTPTLTEDDLVQTQTPNGFRGLKTPNLKDSEQISSYNISESNGRESELKKLTA